MATEHTPAPWRLTDDPVRRVIRGGKPEHTICIIDRWTEEPDAKLIAAAPALADEAEKLIEFFAHIVEYAHYQTDTDLPADILRRIEDEARGVARLIGYDGTTSAALRLAGRIP